MSNEMSKQRVDIRKPANVYKAYKFSNHIQ